MNDKKNINMNNNNDFKKFALSEGISSNNLNYYEKIIEGNLTPYILEEREMRVTQMDVFSRLLRDRIIWLSGVVNQHMCDIVQAQLMFLDNLNNNDITLHINSPGGSVLHGLGVVDVMRYIKSDVATINTGMAASMGSILLSSGTKGKRSSLNFSKVMIHQVSSGAQGHVQDNRISQMESEKYNYILFKMLAENSGRSFDEVLESARRDKWLNSQEALDFGFIDEIIVSDKTSSITTLMDGFEDYYQKEILHMPELSSKTTPSVTTKVTPTKRTPKK
jgi:ATP-dependent Clp protease protease subunit